MEALQTLFQGVNSFLGWQGWAGLAALQAILTIFINPKDIPVWLRKVVVVPVWVILSAFFLFGLSYSLYTSSGKSEVELQELIYEIDTNIREKTKTIDHRIQKKLWEDELAQFVIDTIDLTKTKYKILDERNELAMIKHAMEESHINIDELYQKADLIKTNLKSIKID